MDSEEERETVGNRPSGPYNCPVVATPHRDITLFKNLGESRDLWDLVQGDISRVPRLTIMLVHRVGWQNSAEHTLTVINQFAPPFPMIPTNKGVFVTLQRQGKLAGCIGTFGGSEGNLIDRVMLYTLRSTFEDKRFSDHQLRSLSYCNEAWMTRHWSFTTTLLDTSFQILTEEFWGEYSPGVHGITLHYKGRSATFLPKVIVRWWPVPWEEQKTQPNLSASQRIQFEEEVFGSLLRKMGHHNVSAKRWKQGVVHLYEGVEYIDQGVN
mmetsp:Transcript_32272/g.44305  ORF Transcript_32272/g.44305 Transcript_32272/m.44305 type:complete len:267 (+) Transcript_32272:100-900(+)